MDSTVSTRDRFRYVNAVRSVLGKIRDGIRTMRDPVLGLGSIDTSRKLFIVNKYIDLALQAVDMGMGSGERITSGANRHVKTLNQGFELVHELGFELGMLVFRLWLLYEPGEHQDLTEPEINRIKNGAYLRHHDSAFDLGIGDGDDNLSIFCSLKPLMIHEASEKMVAIHAKCYKILEPAFNSEFQCASEILSRVHVAHARLHFPLPARFLQKTVLAHLNCHFDPITGYVRMTGSDYAQVSTALIQRVYAARQLPCLRWLALALAEKYADLARAKGWMTSVYSDDDRRKGLEDGDYVLQAMCSDMRDWLHGAVIDYDEVVRVLADGKDVQPDTARELAYADHVWAEMNISKEMIYHRDIFDRAFPLPGDVGALLGVESWDAIDSTYKLVKAGGDCPSPSDGNATSLPRLDPPRRVRAGKSHGDTNGTSVASGVAKPSGVMGRHTATAKGVASTPADTCQDSAASMHRGNSANTTVVATVPLSVAHNSGSSGATSVCGSGMPGPSEPGEGQTQAQTLRLAEVLPTPKPAESGGCQTPAMIPLVRSNAVGGVVEALQGSPQPPSPEAVPNGHTMPSPWALTVRPGSDTSAYFDNVVTHLRRHGPKDTEQLVAEHVLPVYATEGVAPGTKYRKFANKTMNELSKTGRVACMMPSSSSLGKWFVVGTPPGI
jgi:hypothetical protein